MCKFSIIVPCYNIANSVEELFNMLSSKSYKNYEVIFVDDCSKDNSFEIMQNMAVEYSNFKVYQPDKNGGPGLARNLGLQHAEGEYIIFCDSDDQFDISVLEKMEMFLAEHSDADMLVSPHHRIKKKRIDTIDMYKQSKHGTRIDGQDVILGQMAPWGKVYKSEIIRSHQIKFPARRTGEDICFVVTYVTRCNAIYKYDIAYYGYVCSQSSITHGKPKDFESTFDILQPIYHEYFPELEITMFAQDHLLMKAKYLTSHRASLKELKAYFAEQNLRYPNWIEYVDIKQQSAYRRSIYQAIYHNRPFIIKLIMLMRRILY